MVRSSGSRLEHYILKVCHVKIQALITDHLISKRWVVIYLDYLEYDLPQYEVDELYPITFREYLANMAEKTGKYV